ncbi:RrF2 family transcriptional regulator [Enterobacter bugandensis]|uniref:RrF2 family transcriptional regulator n=1 Tax=Enterobacter bugandensis TaxID=881260 RepID=UPI00235F1F91|nr:Rrf2 family transcriptional regulator [Enterobacter bugandensis]
MQISSRCQFAIQVTLYLTRAEKAVTAREMQQRLGISVGYLDQLLSIMRKKEIVKATRGPGGGYRLARSSDSITAEEVIRSFQDEEREHPAGSTDEIFILWQQFCRNTWQYLGTQTLSKMARSGWPAE